MTKHFFQHDYEATNDPKIIAMLADYGAVGYGLYWRIVEILHSDPKHTFQSKFFILTSIAHQMKSVPEFINEFISDCVHKYELFTQKGDVVICERVIRNINYLQDIKEKRKAAGSKGGQASAKQRSSKGAANSSNDKKRKDKKGNEIKEKKETLFLSFWEAYDKPNDKAKCKDKFLKLDEEVIEQILKHVPAYVLATPDKTYRKNPLTYLNGRCWEDEPATPKKPTLYEQPQDC